LLTLVILELCFKTIGGSMNRKFDTYGSESAVFVVLSKDAARRSF
jgi:hypothetical protein